MRRRVILSRRPAEIRRTGRSRRYGRSSRLSAAGAAGERREFGLQLVARTDMEAAPASRRRPARNHPGSRSWPPKSTMCSSPPGGSQTSARASGRPASPGSSTGCRRRRCARSTARRTARPDRTTWRRRGRVRCARRAPPGRRPGAPYPSISAEMSMPKRLHLRPGAGRGDQVARRAAADLEHPAARRRCESRRSGGRAPAGSTCASGRRNAAAGDRYGPSEPQARRCPNQPAKT